MEIKFNNNNKILLTIVGTKTRGKNTEFKFNTKIQVFHSYGEALRFEVEALNHLRGIDKSLEYKAYYISEVAQAPSSSLKVGNKYYCPYCGQVNYLVVNNTTGYKTCPICSISTQDYEFKKNNNLWLKDDKNAETGKKKRRRKVEN